MQHQRNKITDRTIQNVLVIATSVINRPREESILNYKYNIQCRVGMIICIIRSTKIIIMIDRLHDFEVRIQPIQNKFHKFD